MQAKYTKRIFIILHTKNILLIKLILYLSQGTFFLCVKKAQQRVQGLVQDNRAESLNNPTW